MPQNIFFQKIKFVALIVGKSIIFMVSEMINAVFEPDIIVGKRFFQHVRNTVFKKCHLTA